MADKEGMERKVYLLPAELVERMRTYQTSQGIASEVEAARRLLDSALQMRDTVDGILAKLKANFASERDLRALNKEVLAAHPLITKIVLDDTSVTFTMRTGDIGRINSAGQIFSGNDESDDYLKEIVDPPRRRAVAGSSQPIAAPSWEPNRGGDLDEEIPF